MNIFVQTQVVLWPVVFCVLILFCVYSSEYYQSQSLVVRWCFLGFVLFGFVKNSVHSLAFLCFVFLLCKCVRWLLAWLSVFIIKPMLN